MLGRDRDRFAEAQLPGFQEARPRPPRLGLVGNQNDRLAGAAHHVGEGRVVGHQPRLGVDDEQDEVSLADGDLGLGAHAPG